MLDRTQFVGASDVPAIMGISPWTSPWKMWALKTGAIPPEPQTPAQAFGHRIQRWICEQADAGYYEFFDEERHVHPRIPFFAATVDRQGYADDGRLVIVEAKNVGAGSAKYWRGGPPDYVVAQVQAQLACTGADHAIIVALIGGNRIERFIETPNPRAIAHIEESVTAFWHSVQLGDPPPADGSSEYFTWLNGLRDRAASALEIKKGAVAIASPEADVVLRDLLAAKAALKAAKAKEEELSAQLKDLIAPGKTDGVFGTVSWVPVEGGANKSAAFDAGVADGSIPLDLAKKLLATHRKLDSMRLTVAANPET